MATIRMSHGSCTICFSSSTRVFSSSPAVGSSAAGERVRLPADRCIHGRAAVGVPFGKTGSGKGLYKRFILLRRAGEHGEIVADGGAEDEGLLGQQRDLPAEIGVPVGMAGAAVDGVFAFRAAHGGQHLQKRRLPRPALAEQRDAVALLERQIDVL